MGKRFIPDGDLDFAEMAEGFATAISRDPERYTLVAHDVEVLTPAVKAFRAALMETLSNKQRNSVSVRAKDDARKNAVEIVQRLGRIIRASDQIEEPDKVAVGIHPRDPRPTKRTVPPSAPHLQYLGTENDAVLGRAGLHVIRFTQAEDITGRRKPHGAVRVELFVDLVADGQPIPRYPGEFLGGRPWYLRSFTSSPMKVAPPVPPTPMLVVYWARWADAKGNVGRFSKTLVTRVEGWGGIAADRQLGPMPQVKQLERDPKYLTAIGQLRQVEAVTGELLLPDSGEGGEAEAEPARKRLAVSDAA